MSEAGELLTPMECAIAAKVSRSLIADWLNSGRLPCVRDARGWRFVRPEDLRTLIQERRRRRYHLRPRFEQEPAR